MNQSFSQSKASHRNRRTGNVLNFLVLFCLIFSTVVGTPVAQAQAPKPTTTQAQSETPTVSPPQTESPTTISGTPPPVLATATPSLTTPIATEPLLPTLTLPPSLSLDSVTPMLSLSTSPDFITAGGNLILNWAIEGLSPKEYQLVLQITLPDEVSLQNIKGGEYDPTTRVLTIPVTDASGQVHLDVGAVSGDLLITAAAC